MGGRDDRRAKEDRAALELLAALITAPPKRGVPPLRPAALRSTDEQRELALAPFLIKTWVDRLLHNMEWLLVLATVAFFSYWLLDGYGRDWLHDRQAAKQTTPAAAGAVPPAAVAEAAQPLRADALPFTTPAMEQAPALDDYLVPRRSRGVVTPAADPRPSRLQIAVLGLDTPVVEVGVVDGAWQVADYAAGYHRGSGLPGDVGNTVLAGHAGLRGGVFRDLGQLTPGDDVLLDTGNWRYRYRVRALSQVLPHQIEVMAPTPTPVLTLITCTAWDTQRLIVVADLIEARPLGPG